MIPIAQWETGPPDQVRTLRPEGVELGKMLAGFRHPVSFPTRKYVLGKGGVGEVKARGLLHEPAWPWHQERPCRWSPGAKWLLQEEGQ